MHKASEKSSITIQDFFFKIKAKLTKKCRFNILFVFIIKMIIDSLMFCLNVKDKSILGSTIAYSL